MCAEDCVVYTTEQRKCEVPPEICGYPVYLEREKGSLTLGNEVADGTLCTWSVDLKENAGFVQEWTVKITLQSGKIRLFSYQLSDNFTAEAVPYESFVVQSSAQLLIDSNYLEIVYSTPVFQSHDRGFLLTWERNTSDSSQSLIILLVLILVPVFVTVLCCSCVIFFCYRGRRRIKQVLVSMLSGRKRVTYREVQPDRSF